MRTSIEQTFSEEVSSKHFILPSQLTRFLRRTIDTTTNAGSLGQSGDGSTRGTSSDAHTAKGGSSHTLQTIIPIVLAIAVALSVLACILTRHSGRRYALRRGQIASKQVEGWKPSLHEAELLFSKAKLTSWKDIKPITVEHTSDRQYRTLTVTSERSRGHLSSSSKRDSFASFASVGSHKGEEVSTLSVAVFIAMPSEKDRSCSGDSKDRDPDGDEAYKLKGGLCLGIVEVPWDLDCHG